MTGKPIRLAVLLALVHGTALVSSPARADCSAFRAEAEAVSGIVPKFDDKGQLHALLSFGTATFIAPKQSLIDKARTAAELKAKRAFAEWLSQAVKSSSALTETLETNEETNQLGDTKALAKELTKQVEAMASNTEATLQGLVKLDECVDTAANVVMVELGWRADLQRAAEQGLSGTKAATGVEAPNSKVNPADGYRLKSPLKDNF